MGPNEVSLKNLDIICHVYIYFIYIIYIAYFFYIIIIIYISFVLHIMPLEHPLVPKGNCSESIYICKIFRKNG